MTSYTSYTVIHTYSFNVAIVHEVQQKKLKKKTFSLQYFITFCLADLILMVCHHGRSYVWHKGTAGRENNKKGREGAGRREGGIRRRGVETR